MVEFGERFAVLNPNCHARLKVTLAREDSLNYSSSLLAIDVPE
jgi:hypothetical protein